MAGRIRPRLAAAILAALLAATAAAQAADAVQPTPAAFASLDGTPLTARLFLPGTLPPRGTVVALHGCGGPDASVGARKGLLAARHQALGELLRGQGYAVLFPDSFGPRGVRELCTRTGAQRTVSLAMRRDDALAAMDWAARQPWGDAARIALLGWSHGGSTLLEAIDLRNPPVREAAVRPQVAIAFYPGCGGYRRAALAPSAPLVLLLAANDDWTDPGSCILMGRAAGAQVEVYPDAFHGFDNPVGGVVLRTDVPGGVRPGQGVHVGANPAAREAATRRLLQALEQAMP